MIRELLDAESDRTRWAGIKCREIVKDTPSLTRTTRPNGLEVEITQVRQAGGVVEVFARAWQDGQQIGFGKNGDVDIERFRIVNPPVYVPDPAGSYERSGFDEDSGLTITSRYREDAREAILQRIEHAIRVKKQKVIGSAAIVSGRTGKTTTQFPPHTGDGWVEYLHSSEDWNATHDAATGTSVTTTGDFVRVAVGNNASDFSFIRRGFFAFDTSSLGGDTIIAATLSLKSYSSIGPNDDNDGNDFWVPVGPCTPGDPTALATADYDQMGAVDNPTELSDTRVDFGGFTADVYQDWDLNAAGLSEIDGAGYSMFSIREGHDILDDTPGPFSPSQANAWRCYSVDAAGTSNDPVLTVEHSGAYAYDQQAFRFRNDNGTL